MFRYVSEVDFSFSNVIIAHVSILVAPLLLNHATKTNSVFNIFVFLHFHHHPSHDHHRHHQAYDHHHRSHHQLRNLMLIMISKWFQSYLKVIFLGSSKKYSNSVLKAVFSHRKLSKTLLYVHLVLLKNYGVLYNYCSPGPQKVSSWAFEVKILFFEVHNVKHVQNISKDTSKHIVHIIVYNIKTISLLHFSVMFSKLILLFQMFYISCFYPRGSFAPQ